LELQRAVQQIANIVEVAEEIAHPAAHHPWRDALVAAYHRQEYPLVEAMVEVIDAPVPRLPRVVDGEGSQGGNLEFALIQAWVELEVFQRPGETIFIDRLRRQRQRQRQQQG